MTTFKLTNVFHKKQELQNAREFSSFYEHAHLNVFRYVMTLSSGDQLESEDITADAFMRAWDRRESFSGNEDEAVRWVITIARNVLIDRHRSKTHEPIPIELDDSLEDTLSGDSTDIEDLLISEEQLQNVLDVIYQLPFRQREILTLRYMLGWRVQVIAAHLNLSENAVSVDLRRALKKIQGLIVPKGANDEN